MKQNRQVLVELRLIVQDVPFVHKKGINSPLYCFHIPKLKVEEYGDEVFDRLNKGAHIYFCGLKGMMPGILQMLQGIAESKKLKWEDFLKGLKEKGEWLIFTP